MSILEFILKICINFYTIAFVLRIWMQLTQCDYYDPLSQIIIKITQPLINIISQIMPFLDAVKTIPIVVVSILSLIKYPLLLLVKTKVFFFKTIYIVFAIISLFKMLGELLFGIIMIQSLISCFNYSNTMIELFFYRLLEPITNFIRRIIPPIGQIDFSTLIIILVCYIINDIGKYFLTDIWGQL